MKTNLWAQREQIWTQWREIMPSFMLKPGPTLSFPSINSNSCLFGLRRVRRLCLSMQCFVCFKHAWVLQSVVKVVLIRGVITAQTPWAETTAAICLFVCCVVLLCIRRGPFAAEGNYPVCLLVATLAHVNTHIMTSRSSYWSFRSN